ncbi:hypothetical protein [Pseudoruegeria sp. SHC-113]|uniref:hypothetical protein n=1 Tax=Pseudoruegeria sp. SHC-113 TaxID=2855439 RepID=UPI0021BB5ECA|nr:hypothetical protein [Pseudoruegeria sp. SHC-113]MCT8159868.1 hypothetical protein [Pseudoruegeria sp. SHC-113]
MDAKRQQRPGRFLQGRRGFVLGGLGAICAAALGARGSAHPGHENDLIDVQVIFAQVRERDLDLRLRLVAKDGARLGVVDAFLLGAIVGREGLPVRLSGSAARVVDFPIRFPGPVPAQFQLDLVIAPLGVLQPVYVTVGAAPAG